MIEEDQVRDTLAWLEAAATDDTEALDVLAGYCDLRAIADGLADLCLVLMQHFGDPIGHVDRMFLAADVRDGR